MFPLRRVRPWQTDRNSLLHTCRLPQRDSQAQVVQSSEMPHCHNRRRLPHRQEHQALVVRLSTLDKRFGHYSISPNMKICCR